MISIGRKKSCPEQMVEVREQEVMSIWSLLLGSCVDCSGQVIVRHKHNMKCEEALFSTPAIITRLSIQNPPCLVGIH